MRIQINVTFLFIFYLDSFPSDHRDEGTHGLSWMSKQSEKCTSKNERYLSFIFNFYFLISIHLDIFIFKFSDRIKDR